MISAREAVTLIRSPWTENLQQLLSLVDQNLVIACPFVKRFATERIVAQLDQRQLRETVQLRLITDLRPESALAGSMDLDALSHLGRNIPGFELTHLPSVHAKVYVADNKMAIITSGNLTRPGLSGNVEYGVALTDESTVGEVRSDLENYATLGARIPMADVAALSAEMEELRDLFQRQQTSVRDRARCAFKEKPESTHVRLLRHRVSGRTTHAIFSEAIRFLLAKGAYANRGVAPLGPIASPGPVR